MSIIACTLAAGVLAAQNNTAQDSTGLPGDNFSLEGALAMFKKAGSPQEFERLINTQNNGVNNLDLNGDGEADYIRVIDKRDGDDHALILQDVVSETESQDVAVIEVERKGNQDAVLQIVGDEDLYGEQRIVEPSDVTNPAPTTTYTYTPPPAQPPVVVNVWGWPAVQYMYGPAYTVWASPWGWGAWPVWWRPWRPVYYPVFYGYCAPYRPYYRVVYYHRVGYAHRMYAPMRTTSVIVRTRTAPVVMRYRDARSSHVIYQPTGGRYRPTGNHYNSRPAYNNRPAHNSRPVYNNRPAGGSRYQSNDRDRGRPSRERYQSQPRNYQSQPRNYQSQPRNYQSQPRNYQSQPRNADHSRSTSYQPRPSGGYHVASPGRTVSPGHYVSPPRMSTPHSTGGGRSRPAGTRAHR